MSETPPHVQQGYTMPQEGRPPYGGQPPPGQPPTDGPPFYGSGAFYGYYPQPPTNGHGKEYGFFSALFDVGFKRYATPSVVSVLYVLIMIGAALYGIVTIISGLALMTQGDAYVAAGFGIVVAGVLGPIIALVFYRLVLEFFVVQFRILDAIKDRNGRS